VYLAELDLWLDSLRKRESSLISHAHTDHIGGAKHLQDTYGARIVMSVEDWEFMHSAPLRGVPPEFPQTDIAVRDGYAITLGDTRIDLYFTPGHTPGTLSFVFPVRDGDAVHYVGYLGGSGIPQRPEDIAQFMASIDRFARVEKGRNQKGSEGHERPRHGPSDGNLEHVGEQGTVH